MMKEVKRNASPLGKRGWVRLGIRRGVGDKPMSSKPGVVGSIPGFSQSVG